MLVRALSLTIVLAVYGCHKASDEPTVQQPQIIGEWAINRVTYSGFPAPLGAYNRTDSSSTHIGTDTYIFRADSTYTEIYSGYNFYSTDSLTPNKGVETGTWRFSAKPVPTLTLRPDTPPGAFIQKPYTVLLTASNELKATYSVSFPLAGYVSPYYDEEIYYRKKL